MGLKDLPAPVIPIRGRAVATEAPDQRALIAAVAAGDRGALASLYKLHADGVAAFLGRISHVDQRDVDDLLQEVFIAVHKGAARYEGRASVRTWIFSIAANLARASARRSIRRRLFRQRLAEGPQPVPVTSVVENAARRELVERLRGHILALPYKQRVAFVMCDVEEVAGVEAAHVLGIPTGTLYRRLHEARRALRAQLGEGWR